MLLVSAEKDELVYGLNVKRLKKKIAAIGIRIRHWVTFHGIAVNVNPNLEHFSGIVPCGISQYGITSLEELNIKCTMFEVDRVLRKYFLKTFSVIN